MTGMTAEPPPDLVRRTEQAGFHHEAALNATWNGARLAAGALTFTFGALVFAFFFLRSLNSHGRWYPATFTGPRQWSGALIMALVLASALGQYLGLRRLKAGHKAAWQAAASAALALGLGAVGVQIWQLTDEPFFPGSAGFASVFTGTMPVFTIVAFSLMVWLEILIVAVTQMPGIFFVEQPPTIAAAFEVQRLQARLSAFTLIWNYLAVVALILWVLFYLVR